MENQKSKVAVVVVDSYDTEKVYEGLKRGLEELGGIGRFVSPNEKILVKPNLLVSGDASKAIATHPSVLAGMLRILQEYGNLEVRYGDSPGMGTSEGVLKSLGVPTEQYGARMASMDKEVLRKFPEGKNCREFYFAGETEWADGIISLCKMKTHALERITGAVKNVYGLVCGYRKAAGHVKYPTDTSFAGMLTDIHRCLKPRLHICDGIMAMEGNGPSGGHPTPMNVLLFSQDPVALDTVFCYLVDVEPKLIPTNVAGEMAGIGTYREEAIEIVVLDGERRQVTRGELFDTYGNGAFDVGREKAKMNFLQKYSRLCRIFAPRPHIDESKCVACGVCVEHCPIPEKAVDFRKGKNRPPVYDYSKCIRCYCCQEMCPKSAISKRGDK